MPGILVQNAHTLEMIKWEHSIFALPFALTAVMLAAHGCPPWRTIAWILVAMVAARSCAMAFNRWADADWTPPIPAPARRAIPAGLLSRQFVLGFTCSPRSSLCWPPPSSIAHALPVAAGAAVLLGYSYLKRVTRWSHLGWAGARPGALGGLDRRPRLARSPHPGAHRGSHPVGGGFDVLYACQDFEHDRAAGLHSLPQAIGIPAAFWAARAMHLAMLACSSGSAAVSISDTRLAGHRRRRPAAGL
jgi:4-hydroxybenzoate polyprenyltransferase